MILLFIAKKILILWTMEKNRHHIFAILLIACILVACGGHTDRPGLVALDSLILQDPDSACELLAVYPADSLPTADDRAYHALLTTIADYKETSSREPLMQVITLVL